MSKLNDQDLVQSVIELARANGAREAEGYYTSARELTIEIVNQEIETMKVAEDRGLGLRVLVDDRMGFAFTTDFSSQALKDVAFQAVANAAKTTGDEFNCLPQPPLGYPDLAIYDPSIEKVSLDAKIKFAQEIEKRARGYDTRVKITEGCSYQDAIYQITIANSRGLAGAYRGAMCGGYALVVAQDGDDNQTGFGMQYRLHFNELDPEIIGREAGSKAVRMLGAREIGTVKASLVLDPYVATNFLGLLAPALTAEAVQKGKSLLKGKTDQEVASALITVVDDGAMEGGVVSAPFDGEGVPSSRTVLLDKGVLKGFLHNTYTASKENRSSTGNASRHSFKSTPEVGTTNFFIEAGATPRDQLLKEVSKGLYVTEVMGMHTANPISGDFSLGAAGLWIENGEFTRPVRGVAIAGNILELFRSVDCVGSDLTIFVSKGSPTLRIPGITISGT